MNMKTHMVTLVIILSFGIGACSTTYVLTKVPQQPPPFTTQYMSYEELRAKADGKIVTIVMRDGNQERGILSCADPDSIAWADSKTGSTHSVPTSRVEHLELSRNYVWEGGTFGLLLFTVPPLATGAWGPQYPSRLNEPDYTGRYFTVIGGVFGGFLGAGVGAGIKHTDIMQVVPLAGGSTPKSDSTK
jgi:hypothetical protein